MQDIKIKISSYKLKENDIELLKNIKQFYYKSLINIESQFLQKYAFLDKLTNLKLWQYMVLAIGDITITSILEDLKFMKSDLSSQLERLIYDTKKEIIFGKYEVNEKDLKLFTSLKDYKFIKLPQATIDYIAALSKLKIGDKMIVSFDNTNLSELAEYFYTPDTEDVNKALDNIRTQEKFLENSFVNQIRSNSSSAKQISFE